MKVNTKAELENLVNSNDKVVVDFYADWCGPCKVLGRMLESYNGDTVIAKVDCDVSGELAKEYGVRSIPYVVKFEGGQEVDNFVGVPNQDKLNEFLG